MHPTRPFRRWLARSAHAAVVTSPSTSATRTSASSRRCRRTATAARRPTADVLDRLGACTTRTAGPTSSRPSCTPGRSGPVSKGCVCEPWCTTRPKPIGCASWERTRPSPVTCATARASTPILTGVDAVFHVTPAFAPDSAELGVSMVEAATAAGVDRFVFSGVYHRSLSLGEPRASMRPIEEALLVGEGGLLARLTKRVVEAGIRGEIKNRCTADCVRADLRPRPATPRGRPEQPRPPRQRRGWCPRRRLTPATLIFVVTPAAAPGRHAQPRPGRWRVQRPWC